MTPNEHRQIADAIWAIRRKETRNLPPGYLAAIRQAVLHDVLSMEGDARTNAEELLEAMAPGRAGYGRTTP